MWEFFWLAAISVTLIDQITKIIVERTKMPYYVNKWGPLGSYEKRSWIQYPLYLLHIVILIPLITNNGNYNMFSGAGLIFGGLSNTFDRIVRHGVIDFIPMPYKVPNQPYPAKLNIADLSIAAGILLYTVGLFK